VNTDNPVILSIDPGTVILGYAIVAVRFDRPILLEMGVLKLAGEKDIYTRLELIYKKVSELVVTHQAGSFAIEAPFYGKNVQSMLKLGRAQGVAIAAAMQYKLPVCEYSPKKIKQAVTGNGNASKEQVWKMLQHELQIEETPKYFDATDALAVAICHYYQIRNRVRSTSKNFKNWEDFIQKNKNRIRK
jgi:crossover junction endodeoxyribonuclease RuvC